MGEHFVRAKQDLSCKCCKAVRHWLNLFRIRPLENSRSSSVKHPIFQFAFPVFFFSRSLVTSSSARIYIVSLRSRPVDSSPGGHRSMIHTLHLLMKTKNVPTCCKLSLNILYTVAWYREARRLWCTPDSPSSASLAFQYPKTSRASRKCEKCWARKKKHKRKKLHVFGGCKGEFVKVRRCSDNEQLLEIMEFMDGIKFTKFKDWLESVSKQCQASCIQFWIF